MTITLGLIGSGISRSRMPRLQRCLGQLHGIDIDYRLIDAQDQPGFDPVSAVLNARQAGFRGVNVTHPFKQTIHSMVAAPHIAGHEQIGSYNTLLFADNCITGANTDYSGFIKAYRHLLGTQTPGRVLLCGAGGVGRAVAMGLRELGCKYLWLYDVAPQQTASLAAALRHQDMQVDIIGPQDLPAAITAADGLINCTALGMHNKPGSAIDLTLINQQRWAFDAVYTPLHTQFMTHCKKAGLQCLSGFDLWIHQGLDAFGVFTGLEVKASDALVNEALSWLD